MSDLIARKIVPTDTPTLRIAITSPCGCCASTVYMYSDQPDVAFLCALCTLPACRNKGYGTQMVKQQEAVATKLGANCVQLWCEADSWVRGWYERLGYSYLQDHKEPGYVWMQKNLNTETTTD